MTSSSPLLGYCTNVHAGANWEEMRANLRRHAVGVKERFSPNEPMGVGLWLSSSSAGALRRGRDGGRLEEFAGWLAESGLRPYTFNGFPYGDFHQSRVKHLVYQPDWTDPARLEYTTNLIEILDALLPIGETGSISTLPLGWGSPKPDRAWLDQTARQLRAAARTLARLERETGRLIHLNLEPEPGCVLQRGSDVVHYFQDVLLAGQTADDEASIRRHLRVCHDVCHAAVMFESQTEVWETYRAAGIRIGKVQISSAAAMPLTNRSPEERDAAIRRLSEFVEERYLHQTVIRSSRNGAIVETFYEDLPQALAARSAGSGSGPSDQDEEWRVHFHVPIFLERIGALSTTQGAIVEFLDLLQARFPQSGRSAAIDPDFPHLEAETYAWDVLPPDLRGDGELATGIARELQWLRDRLRNDV